jgi:hypothetical protein
MRVSFFCTFHNEHGDAVYVNPTLVRYFTAAPVGGDLTRLFFDSGHSLIVRASPVEVENGLTLIQSSKEI